MMKKLIALFVGLLFAASLLAAVGFAKNEEPAKLPAQEVKPAEPPKSAEPEKKAEEAKAGETNPPEKAPEKN